MKKITYLLSIIFFVSCGTSNYEKQALFWYLPTMNIKQAQNLRHYDLIVIDYENWINNPSSIDTLMTNNKLKLFIYLNPTEIFEPMWSDKPWSIKLLAEMQEKPQWWLYNPQGEKIGLWPGMFTLDMRYNSPEIDSLRYWQFIAQKFLEILHDPRLSGCLVDNSWGDDKSGVSWLGWDQGGVDFDRDSIADQDFFEIDQDWSKGVNAFLREIRKAKGKDFLIILNPGNISYTWVDGKQLEHFPYTYHNLDARNHWEANLQIIKSFDIIIVNPDDDDYFLGLCTSLMFDAYYAKGQNTFFRDYELNLGKARRKMRQLNDSTFFRRFRNGNIYIQNGQNAWIEYKDGTIRKE